MNDVARTADKTQQQASSPGPATSGESAWYPLQTFRDEMDRLFDDVMSGFSRPFGRRPFDIEPRRRLAMAAGSGFPAVDIAERDKHYQIRAELPGLEEKEIDLSVTDDLLTLKGEKRIEHEEKGENRYLSERRYGAFERSFRLPPDADAGKIAAEFKNGVLTITVPKSVEAEAKRQKVAVKTA